MSRGLNDILVLSMFISALLSSLQIGNQLINNPYFILYSRRKCTVSGAADRDKKKTCVSRQCMIVIREKLTKWQNGRKTYKIKQTKPTPSIKQQLITEITELRRSKYNYEKD